MEKLDLESLSHTLRTSKLSQSADATKPVGTTLWFSVYNNLDLLFEGEILIESGQQVIDKISMLSGERI
jgi:hypothetical protein